MGQILNNEGFNGLYDFIFLPTSLRTGRSTRYAIVNFTRHSYGLLLAAHFHGHNFCISDKDGPLCKVKWSFNHQGLPALLEHYRNDANMHESVPCCMQPALFYNGWRMPMPAPTKRIRTPSIRDFPYRSTTKEYVQPIVDTDVIDHVVQLESISEFP